MKNSHRLRMAVLTGLFVCLAGPFAAIAQVPVPSNATVYASGLLGRRGLAFGPDGLLYVAEAGSGGQASTVGVCTQVPGPIGPYKGGATGRISKIVGNQPVTVRKRLCFDAGLHWRKYRLWRMWRS